MRISLLALGLLLSFPALAEALDPAAIMRAVRDRDEGQDRRSEVTLVQTMADGFVRERKLLMLEKEYGEERCHELLHVHYGA